jgi:CheY-like chemotaxis protein
MDILEDVRPDLVLLDLMLPKTNGVQVLKKIRATPGLNAIPVIVFTNGYMGSLMRDAMLAGATHCFAKAQTPPRQVVQAICEYLHLSKTAAPAPAGPSRKPELGSPHKAPSQGMAKMRAALQGLAKAESQSDRSKHLAALAAAFSECGHTNQPEFAGVVQLARALQALTDAQREPSATTALPLLRILAHGVDCLNVLSARAAQGHKTTPKTSLVLVLDGDPASRQLMCLSLERVGLRPVEAHDPKAALGVLATKPFDLVLVNTDGHAVNGIEFCKQVRDSDSNKATPVVFVTGLSDLEGRAMSIMSGADDVLRKPISPVELGVKALLCILAPRSKPKVPTLSVKPGTAPVAR